jgi:hypothetical protein
MTMRWLVLGLATAVVAGASLGALGAKRDAQWRALAGLDNAEAAEAQMRANESDRAAVSRGVATFVVSFVLALAALPAAAAFGGEITCETSGDIRHCFDHHGFESTEERSPGGYTHGHDNQGRAWTMWTQDGATTTWPTR